MLQRMIERIFHPSKHLREKARKIILKLDFEFRNKCTDMITVVIRLEQSRHLVSLLICRNELRIIGHSRLVFSSIQAPKTVVDAAIRRNRTMRGLRWCFSKQFGFDSFTVESEVNLDAVTPQLVYQKVDLVVFELERCRRMLADSYERAGFASDFLRSN